MPKVLTTKQIKSYREDGFVFPVRVISEDEALSIANKIEEAEQLYPEEIHPESRNNLHLCFSFLDGLVHNRVVVEAMQDLFGPNLSLWASVLFCKESSSSQYVSWHQDATYMGMNSNNFATPWIALTPSTVEMGCMSMIPGSYDQKIREHEDTFDDDNILTRGQDITDVDDSNAVDVILRPGEMSIHSGTVVHGSKPNRSNNRRVGFALQSFMPPSINQAVGRNIWSHVCGKKRNDGEGFALDRPRYDMDPVSVSQRKMADENLANILYKGSKIKRNY
jgi:hypothetical protein